MLTDIQFSELSHPPSRLRYREVKEGMVGKRVTKLRPIIEYEMLPGLWRQRNASEVEENSDMWESRIRRNEPALWGRIRRTADRRAK